MLTVDQLLNQYEHGAITGHQLVVEAILKVDPHGNVEETAATLLPLTLVRDKYPDIMVELRRWVYAYRPGKMRSTGGKIPDSGQVCWVEDWLEWEAKKTPVADRQFWASRKGEDRQYVEYVHKVEDGQYHHCQYQPGRRCPSPVMKDKLYNLGEYLDPVSRQEAALIIGNMDEQDKELMYRLARSQEAESLAKALAILEHVRVSSVDARDGVVVVHATSGASYSIYLTKNGYESDQTGERDPG